MEKDNKYTVSTCVEGVKQIPEKQILSLTGTDYSPKIHS